MKNISVLSTDEAMERISSYKDNYSVLYVVNDKILIEKIYREDKGSGQLNLCPSHRKLRDHIKSDKEDQ